MGIPIMKKAKKSKSIVNTKDYKYDTLRIRGKDGKVRHSANNGDAVAKAMLLHFASGGTLAQIIRDNKLSISKKGNSGTQRMSAGGSLRARINGGESVKIGSIRVKSLKQVIALPKIEAKAKSSSDKKKVVKKAKKARKVTARRPKPQAEQAPAAEQSQS